MKTRFVKFIKQKSKSTDFTAFTIPSRTCSYIEISPKPANMIVGAYNKRCKNNWREVPRYIIRWGTIQTTPGHSLVTFGTALGRMLGEDTKEMASSCFPAKYVDRGMRHEVREQAILKPGIGTWSLTRPDHMGLALCLWLGLLREKAGEPSLHAHSRVPCTADRDLEVPPQRSSRTVSSHRVC